MAEYALPLTAEGSVTAPSGSFTFIEPSAKSQTLLDVGPVSVLEIPEYGFLLADGVNPLREAVRGSIYDVGGLAPGVAPTLALSGAAKASAVLATAAAGTNLANNDNVSIPSSIVFHTSGVGFSPTGGFQVIIGASKEATLQNLQKFYLGTGTLGTEYSLGALPYSLYQSQILDLVTVSAISIPGGASAASITVQAKTYGSSQNSYDARVITSTGVALSVASSPNFTGGADGTGTSPAIGTYRYFYTWLRTADGAETGRSPIASISSVGNWNIAISVLAASADTTFDYIRIYRTETLGTEFWLLGAVPRATSTFTDSVADTTLAAGPPPWNELLHREYDEGQVPRGRALALWKGSVWSLGAYLSADYATGNITATNASASVTFAVKGVTPLMVGRTLIVGSTSEEYTLLSVDPTGPTAVLDRAYEGSTATTTYKIRDDYDACKIRRAVQFLPNQWPVDESPGRVDTDDDEGGTALLATKSRLFAFSRSSIVAVTGDGPDSWELSKVAQGVGCVGPRLVVGVGDGGVFLSPDGFYALSPDESLTCLSSPKAPQKMVAKGIDGTVARINWACADQGYSYYDPTERVVVFGLPLDGALVPNYEIVLDLQNSTWTTFKRSEFTAAMNGTLPGGGQFILSGDREGNLWHVDIGESDGFYGAEAVATLTGAQTVRSLTASGASWATTGDACKGMPFILLYANGTTVAYGKVASNTGTNIVPAEDLATAPAAGDQLILGGIGWQAKSGFTTLGEEYRQKILRSVTIRHAPTTRGEYYLSLAVDNGSLAVPAVGTGIGSLTDADGKVRHFLQYPGDTHSISLRSFKPGGRAVLRGGVFDGFVRELERA